VKVSQSKASSRSKRATSPSNTTAAVVRHVSRSTNLVISGLTSFQPCLCDSSSRLPWRASQRFRGASDTMSVVESARLRHGSNRGDHVFEGAVTVLAGGVPVLIAGIVFLLMIDALPALARYGLGFLTDSTWNPVTEQFGAAAYAFGTIITSIVALLIAGPFGVGCALFIAEYAPPWIRGPVSFVIELLAAIPSIIYGLWGFFVLAPVMRGGVEPFLEGTIGQVPVVGAVFSGPIVGRDLLVASVILAIMILPTVTAVSREVLRACPTPSVRACLRLGRRAGRRSGKLCCRMRAPVSPEPRFWGSRAHWVRRWP
jgi:ABC-type phosphate transport system permease subunit